MPPIVNACRRAASALQWCGMVAWLAACQREEPNESADATASAASAAAPHAARSARPPRHPPLANERVDIPGGTFFAGSVPGQPGRVPEIEPRRSQVELGPFQIDKLPYPNDPSTPPLTSVSRKQAQRLCHDLGARLCTELEWERACRGPDNERYASGENWDPRCKEEPRTCASGFDVLGMGAAIREWTASDVVPSDKDLPPRAAIRGAATSEPGPQHRCAARRGVDPDTLAVDLGFRCCRGAPNAAVVREPTLGQTFVKAKLDTDRLAKMLLADERTSSLAQDVKFFREPEAANTVVARGPGDRKGFLFTVEPLIWNPVAGSEYLIVTGRSGKDTSFVLAYWVTGDDEYRLASSFIMRDEPGPVALAYSGSIRPRLHFSTCWGCPGETGKVLFRRPDSAVILQP